MPSIDPVALAAELIRSDSVTPARGAVFDTVERTLGDAGFAVERFVAGEAPDGPVENLLAHRAGDGEHLAFAGHLDVVPPGDGWSAGPFSGEVRGDLLYGRGAVDMKGAVGAFVSAAAAPTTVPLTLILTGDEEGPAVHGTRALIDRMETRAIRPDLCIVGEPTSVARLGDMIKIGRRGSVNIWIDVPGRQGHVAYPHLAHNPIPALVAILAEIEAIVLDTGSDWFQPSNIEVTEIAVGNPAHNVIPARAGARISIRFNDLQSGNALIETIRSIAERHAPDGEVRGIVSGEAFLTPPGRLSTLVAGAIEERLGVTPELSTTGGTSDARFLSKLCPVVEFGLVNATMHQVDEAVAVEDVAALADVYRGVIERVGMV